MSPPKDSKQMEFDVMSSLQDGHAKIFHTQGNKQVLKENGQDYGLNSPELLAKYDQDSQSWRTSQLSFLETEGDGLAEFSETWPRSGMTVSGTAYQLPTLAHLTAETGYGLLPTPTRTDHKNESMTTKMVKKRLAASSRGVRLSEYLHRRFLATPDAGNDHRGGYLSEYGGKLNPFRGAEIGKLRLNPCWVEELMAFPLGWTDLDA